jgi:hypothetical protein
MNSLPKVKSTDDYLFNLDSFEDIQIFVESKDAAQLQEVLLKIPYQRSCHLILVLNSVYWYYTKKMQVMKP